MTQLVPFDQARATIELAPEAWSLAQKIARTEFVPKGLRDRPEAVLAAILKGHEVGIGPMQALSAIHVIEGKPTMAAELMRALVLRDGHEIWIEDSSSTRCTIAGRRHDSSRETRVTWTMDDAKTAGLSGKDVWRKYPRAMLLARATSELMRAIFPDVIAGISYSLEELTDGDVVDVTDTTADAGDSADPPKAPPAKRTARARRAATSTPAPAAQPAAPKTTGSLPPLPGEEDDDDIDDADVVGEEKSEGGAGTVTDDADVAPPSGPDEGPDQDLGAGAAALPLASRVAMWCNDAGLDDDARHRFLHAFSDGNYSSSRDVSPDDIDDLRATLASLKAGTIRLDADADGAAILVDVDQAAGTTAEPPADPETAARNDADTAWWDKRRWTEELQKRGKTVKASIEQAQTIADEFGLPLPKSLAGWDDARISARLLEWADQA